jgi:aspartate/methionine/tyrosine aminotransferase
LGIDLPALAQMLLPDDLVIINSRANPTGGCLLKKNSRNSDNFLLKLTEGYVLSDEIYSQLIYDGPSNKFLRFFNRTIVLDGISKSGARQV